MIVVNWLRALFYKLFIDLNVDNFPVGIICFAGRQGEGKTISAVEYIYQLKKNHDFLFYSNISVDGAEDYKIADIADLFDIVDLNRGRNILFLLDEIQNTFSSSNSRGFDPSVLSLLTQLRKQHIHIVITSQVFTRLAKPIREQVHTICNCSTWFKRCTIRRYYYADDYLLYYDNTSEHKLDKLSTIRINSFFQDDKLRNMYDTYEVAKKLKNCKNYTNFDN